MYAIRTGNAIITAFFVWLAIDLPFRIFIISETYSIGGFAGMARDDWIGFSFILPFFLALLFAVYGKEKDEKDTYYKKPDEKQIKKDPEIKPDIKVVEKRKEREKATFGIQEHVDELLKDR